MTKWPNLNNSPSLHQNAKTTLPFSTFQFISLLRIINKAYITTTYISKTQLNANSVFIDQSLYININFMGITPSNSWLNCVLSGLGLPIGNGGCRLFGYLRITGEWGILPAKLACMHSHGGPWERVVVSEFTVWLFLCAFSLWSSFSE